MEIKLTSVATGLKLELKLSKVKLSTSHNKKVVQINMKDLCQSLADNKILKNSVNKNKIATRQAQFKYDTQARQLDKLNSNQSQHEHNVQELEDKCGVFSYKFDHSIDDFEERVAKLKNELEE